MSEKSFFRKACLQKRMGMNLTEITPRIAEHVKNFLLENRFDSVGLYYPIRNEIDLRSVLMDLKEKGIVRTLALPRIKDSEMQFVAWESSERLQRDEAGVPASACGPTVKPQCLLVPCLSIDAQGFRLGYGGGWYDRYLSSTEIKLTIGVLPQSLVVEVLPHEHYDQPLSAWVCESGFTWVGKAAENVRITKD